jgi:hypothetical protein
MTLKPSGKPSSNSRRGWRRAPGDQPAHQASALAEPPLLDGATFTSERSASILRHDTPSRLAQINTAIGALTVEISRR